MPHEEPLGKHWRPVRVKNPSTQSSLTQHASAHLHNDHSYTCSFLKLEILVLPLQVSYNNCTASPFFNMKQKILTCCPAIIKCSSIFYTCIPTKSRSSYLLVVKIIYLGYQQTDSQSNLVGLRVSLWYPICDLKNVDWCILHDCTTRIKTGHIFLLCWWTRWQVPQAYISYLMWSMMHSSLTCT